MKVLLALCLVLSLFAISNTSGQDTLGVVGAFRAQTAAWESGDLLIRIEEFYDSTGKNGIGQFHESLGFHRFRFDHQKKLYFYYGYTEGRTGVVKEAGQDAQDRPVVGRKAFLLKDDKGFIREFPSRMTPVHGTSVSEVIAGMNVGLLHLRHLGFCSFGFKSSDCGETMAAAMASGLARQSSAIGEDNTIRIEFQFPARRSDIGNVAELVPKLVWRWDDRRLVPTNSSLYETGVLRGREFTNLRWTEDYDWEEKEGIAVPVAIRHRTPGSVMRGDEIVAYEKYRLATLHWFSVNRGLPEDTESISLDNLQSLETLIDPKKARATTILEAQ